MGAHSEWLGEWELVEGFRRYSEARGPTHAFETAREFLDAVDDDEARWRAPETLRAASPFDGLLTLHDDGRYRQREPSGHGVTRWIAAVEARDATQIDGRWDPTPDDADGFALALHPEFEARSWQSGYPYFDAVKFDAHGELSRRIVTATDGIYVTEILVFYRRPGAEPTPSRVAAYIAEQLAPLRALAAALETGESLDARAAAGGAVVEAHREALERGLLAVRIGPEWGEAWTMAPTVIETMARIRAVARQLKGPHQAAYKPWVKEAVGEYFAALRAAGVEDPT